MLGPAAQDRLLNLYSVLPSTYVAPDDFSIEAILPQVETSTDKLAEIVLASPLKPKHWVELLQKKSNDYGTKTERETIERLRQRGDDLLTEVLTLMIRSTKTKARATGLHYLVTIAEHSEPTVVALAGQVVEQLGEPKGSVSERESQLRLKVKRLFAKTQNTADAETTSPSKSPSKSKKTKPPKESPSSASSPASAPAPLTSPVTSPGQSTEAIPPECQPSAKAAAFYPGLSVTPKTYTPQYKPLVRMTESCRVMLRLLDDLISENLERWLENEPIDKRANTRDYLLRCMPHAWPARYKQIIVDWWDKVSPQHVQAQDLARMATYWWPTANLSGLRLPEGIDLSRLEALKTPDYLSVYTQLVAAGYSVVPAPDTDEVVFLRSLKNPAMNKQALGVLLGGRSTADDCEFMLDMADSIQAALPPEVMSCFDPKSYFDKFRDRVAVDQWISAGSHRAECLRPELARRAYQNKYRTVELSLAMYALGAATLGDVVEGILGLCGSDSIHDDILSYELIADIRRSPARASEFNPFYAHLSDTIIHSELTRPAKELSDWSHIAQRIGYLEGYQCFERLLLATAKKGFTRPTRSLSNQASLWSILTSAIYPEPECDLAEVASRFKALLKAKQVSHQHLLQAAILAPQWSEAIGAALDWPELNKIVIWLDSHMRDANFGPDQKTALWLAKENRTVRLQQDHDGYFDGSFLYHWHQRWLKQKRDPIVMPRHFGYQVHVSWFESIASSVSASQWKQLFEAVSVVLAPKAVQELQAVVDAMLGTADRQAVLSAVQTANNTIDTRPLALLPLAKGHSRGKDLLDRYRALTEYRKRCRRFFEGERATDMTDYALGILAWRVGVSTQDELDWVIQAAAAEQFEHHRLFKSGDIEVQLVIEPDGRPANRIVKAGKVVKTIPPAIKKDKQFEEQQQLLKDLQKFATNSRHMLQRAIAKSQSFTMLEVSQMLAHPVLMPLLSSLLVTDGKNIGLMKEGGKRLLSRDGSVSNLSPQASLRLIHPVDLIDQGGWISWRDWLREQQISQPIPQVERGLFLPEYFIHAPDGPDRYLRLSNPEAARDFLPFFGHHIADSQFRAVLLGSGWDSTDAGFFERELTGARGDARAEFTYQFFSVQILAVSFRMPKNGTYETCYSREVPLIDYSECVREVYLATLASSGTVEDPEASSENSAIRAHLSKRSLPDVRWEGRLLTIEGRLGTYVIDTLNRDMRMQTGQYMPFHAFADDPQQAFIAAIDQLANPESEERVLRKLKHLSMANQSTNEQR